MLLHRLHGSGLVFHAEVHLARILVFREFVYLLAEGLPLLLEGRHDAQHDDAGEHSAVGVEEVLEIVVARKLSAPEAVDFAELGCGEGTADAPGVEFGAVLLQILPYRLGGTDFLEHAGVLLSALDAEVEGHHGDDEVGCHETGLVVDEHHAVGIAVIDYAEVGAGLCHQLLERLHVLGNQRVGLVIREAAVDGIEEPLGVFALVDFLCKKVSHAVGEVEGDLEVAVVAFVFLEECDVVRLDVDFLHHALAGCGRGGASSFYPGLDLAEAGVEANREGVLAGDLHSVVLRRIVRCGDLHGCLVAIFGGAEVHQRSAAEADVVDIRAGIGDALDQIVVHLGRGYAAVAADQHLVRFQKFRKEIAHLVGCILVEINIVDSTNVVCMKCSHILYWLCILQM